MLPSVSAVVVNFNGQDFIGACLDSLLAQSQPFDEILVIDNASQDGSGEWIQTHYPNLRFVQLSTNEGFTGACNRGIQLSRGELVAILNNDLILDPHWLGSLLKHNTAPWDFWASRILFAQEPSRIDSAGDAMAVVGAGYKIGHGEQAHLHSRSKEVFGACGAAALYRRSLLETVGRFDSDFFLVYEDADLNMRARLQGFRCLYVAEAIAHHRVNSSIGTFSYNYVFYGHRNSEMLFWKNMPLSLLLRYLPERLFFDLLAFLYFSWKGQARAFLAGKIDFLRRLPRLLEKRRDIQQKRQLGSKTIRRQLDRNWLRNRRKASVGS